MGGWVTYLGADLNHHFGEELVGSSRLPDDVEEVDGFFPSPFPSEFLEKDAEETIV